ncbi:hypothetical protein HMPREF0742_01898 [Rothia aeria F0184]|uniref:Uncharacterized protein n=1 Tax=Rothia aeria F0184 TaxID=888019 RepID=U7V429_9MICC|nr:hypothetical protein HMPREF0742_01898 [Rothia aeria F0184]
MVLPYRIQVYRLRFSLYQVRPYCACDKISHLQNIQHISGFLTS